MQGGVINLVTVDVTVVLAKLIKMLQHLGFGFRKILIVTSSHKMEHHVPTVHCRVCPVPHTLLSMKVSV
jgi:hypothetical protein